MATETWFANTDALSAPVALADADFLRMGDDAGGNSEKLTISVLAANLFAAGRKLVLAGAISAAAWTTAGIGIAEDARTLTDTSSSGTVAAAYTHVLGGNTIAASSATTFTDYYSAFLTQPTAGTNVTFTRRWALGLSGNLSVTGNILLRTGGLVAASAGNIQFGDGSSSLTTLAASGFVVISASSRIDLITSGGVTIGATDLVVARDAANTLALRNGTNAQTFNWYGNHVSSTDYHRGALKVAKTTLSGVTGASVTATGLIPDGAFYIGVTTKVTTELGATGGTTGYQVGDGSDVDRWGEATTITAGTSTDNTNATANPTGAATSAADVVITAVGGNFDGTGVIDVNVFYIIAQAD